MTTPCQQTESEAPNALDALTRSALGRLTQGLSPAAMTQAYMDWLVHLAISPGKQQELREKAQRKLTRLLLYQTGLARGESTPCIEPLPQDERFNHRDWQLPPFQSYYQSFLLLQQWWWNATSGVHGVTRHHEYMATFFARQWLDMFSPSNFLATNPEVLGETVRTAGMNLAQGAANLWEDVLAQATGKPLAGAEQLQVGKNLALTPGKVILRNRLIELIQYAPQTATVNPEPVLIVPSWIMKYYILDLSPANSLVKYLVDTGHTVFMLSWKNPGAEDRDLGMDNYLRDGVLAALDAVSSVAPGHKINALGYCLGGTLLGIAASALARDGDARLNSLSLLASELDFTEPGELSLFIDESQIAFLEDAMWAQGYLDGKQMAGAFAMLNSKDLVWSKMIRSYLMGQRAPLTDLMAWNIDATRLPYRMHSEYLRQLYLKNDLAEGHYKVDGRPVALTDIRVPMFVLGTQRDHVSPWRSVYKAHLLTDTEVTFVLTSGGHNVGVVNPPGVDVPGRGYQMATRAADARFIDPDAWAAQTPSHEGSWWPTWGAWLRQHAGEPIAPPPMGGASKAYAAIDDAPGQYVLTP
jgi:polyhydroxyalkanoate synthase